MTLASPLMTCPSAQMVFLETDWNLSVSSRTIDVKELQSVQKSSATTTSISHLGFSVCSIHFHSIWTKVHANTVNTEMDIIILANLINGWLTMLAFFNNEIQVASCEMTLHVHGVVLLQNNCCISHSLYCYCLYFTEPQIPPDAAPSVYECVSMVS